MTNNRPVDMKKEDLKKLALKWVKKANRLYDKPFSDISYSYADGLEECGIQLLKKIGEKNTWRIISNEN